MNTYLIRKACIASSGDLVDITIANGVIEQIGFHDHTKSLSNANVIDAEGLLVLPGLFDLHAHLGQPGFENRECIASASAAALHGGVTGLLAMPDTSPAMDNPAQIQALEELCRHESAIDIIPAGCITKNAAGEEQVSFYALKNKGVHFVTDADHVPSNLLLLYRAMQYAAPFNLTFALHGDIPALTANSLMHPSTTSYRLGLAGSPVCAEEIGISTFIRLAQETGAAIHIQTISTAGGAEIVRQWKSKLSTPLSAEVALHHLIFTHEQVGDYDTTFKTLPPLRDKTDNEALIAALQDGTIDCIVSDHTPVTVFEKKQDFRTAPYGMIGLDTFLPALYTYLVRPNLLSWEQIIRLCCDNPRQLMHVPRVSLQESSHADLVLFDPKGESLVSDSFLRSCSRNSPFLGSTLAGKVRGVFVNGVYHDFNE